MTPNGYEGCRLFLSPTGRSGFALGVEGRHTGRLYSLFVAPGEKIGVAAELIKLAVQEGATVLSTYGYADVLRYFNHFGFEAVSRVRFADVKDPPPAWLSPVPSAPLDAYPDVIFMIRRGEANALIEANVFASGNTVNAAPGGREFCGGCGLPIASLYDELRLIAGYQCPRCDFLHMYGMLTLSPH